MLIVVPTYNEKDVVGDCISKIKTCFSDADILIIDDSSPDGTSLVVKEIAKSDNKVLLIQRPSKLGLKSAYLDGFTYAIRNKYDRVVTMDADLSHDPKHLLDMISQSREFDVVIGSRYVAGGEIKDWSFYRRALSLIGNFLVRFLSRIPVKDTTSGFKCFKVKSLRALNVAKLHSKGFFFQAETNVQLYRKGFKFLEVPVVFYGRKKGRSKLDFAIVKDAAKNVWRLVR